VNDVGGGLGYETVSLRILNRDDPARAYADAVAPIALAGAARDDVAGDENGVCYEGVDAASGSAVVGRTVVESVPWANLSHLASGQ